MGTIEILIGISNSGKSTYAHEKWLKDPQNTVVINRDKIRELLFGFNRNLIYKVVNNLSYKNVK